MARSEPVALLGPQRHYPRVAEVLDELGIDGRVAVVTAGWEEREREDDELDQHLSGRTVNLALFPRTDEVLADDPGLQELVAERERRRRELRDLYHLRLAPQLQACRALLNLVEPEDLGRLHQDEVLGPEIEHALAAVRDLDAHHQARVAALDVEIEHRRTEQPHPVLDRHRAEVAELLDSCRALLIAGGHVGTLLSALRLFRVIEQTGDRAIVAWSGGAMVLAERIVLFHDRPARGAGDAEVLGAGFGLVPGVLPMPHAVHRLDLDNRRRVALMARRFAPAACLALDYGDRVILEPPRSARRDGADHTGRVDTVGSGVDDTGHADSVSGGAVELPSTVRVLSPTGEVVGEGSGLINPDVPVERPVPHSPPADVHEELAAITDAARAGRRATARLLHNHRYPVVGDGWALFVFVGPADQVRLHHWISGLPSARPFTRVEGTDVWTLVLDIRPEARVEYKLEVQRGDHTELIRDPLNPDHARDPFGANSVVRGFRYVKPEWTEEHGNARRGTVVDLELESKVFGGPRPYSVYLPARFREDRVYPLVVVHDGRDYADYASFITVLDNLIHRLEIPPLIAALIQSPDRLAEYGANPDHGRHLVDELLPDLESRYRVGPPSRRVLLGASFGGVAALHAAWTHPGAFDKLLLQSGSFAFSDVGVNDMGPVFDPVVEWMARFRANPGRPARRIFLSVGVYESLVYFNRSILPVLQSTGAEVRLVEALDGHNWENWRDHLRDGLTWLLPGPQWLIYE
jgi:enterochelin esterase family protein